MEFLNMTLHPVTTEQNPYGGDRTTADGWRELSPEEQKAGRAELASMMARVDAVAADRAARLAAAPFVVMATWGGVTSWQESRKVIADIRDDQGRPVAVLPTFVWREATGLRTLEQQATGDLVWATAEGEIVASALVDAQTSRAYTTELRFGAQQTANSDWLPAGAARAAYAHWDVTGGVYASENECAEVWFCLLGDAPDQLALRDWAAKRAKKSAKAMPDLPEVVAANPFAALAALRLS